MASRRVVGLKWVKEAKAPFGPSRPRDPRKKAGLRFERAVGEALPYAQRHRWFEYEDLHGKGYCCPDFLIIPKNLRAGILVLECKYTDTPEAWAQLEHLYVPVLSHFYGTKIYTAVVVHSLTPKSQNIVPSLTEAVQCKLKHPVVLWRGRGEFPV